jgi:hypothetical protein
MKNRRKWIANKRGKLYEVREKFPGGYGLLLTINDYTKNKGGKKLADFIACAPEMLNALIEIYEELSDRYNINSPSLNPGLKDIIVDSKKLIEKATGKTWEQMEAIDDVETES